MSEPTSTTPPAKKKGMGALAWILIGCLGILLLGALLTGACGFFVAKKAKDFVEDVAENPVQSAAELYVRANPELELIESDEENETVTVRNKATGEVMTLELADLREGRFTFKTDDQEVTFDAQSEDGLVEVSTTDESGDAASGTTMTFGQGDADKVPDWVPRYPGAEMAAQFVNETADTVNGTAGFETGDSPDEVIAYYREEIEALGLEIENSTSTSAGETEMRILSTKSGTGLRTLSVVASSEGDRTSVSMSFSGPK